MLILLSFMQSKILPKEWCHPQCTCFPTSVSAIIIILLKYAYKALTLVILDLIKLIVHINHHRWLAFQSLFTFKSPWYGSYSEFSVWAGLILVPASSHEKRLKMYHVCFQVSYPLRNTSGGIAKYSRNSQRKLILRFQHLSFTPVSCVTELMIPLGMWQTIFSHFSLQICPLTKMISLAPNSSGCRSMYLNICS